jgi:hypothetical protein
MRLNAVESFYAVVLQQIEITAIKTVPVDEGLVRD